MNCCRRRRCDCRSDGSVGDHAIHARHREVFLVGHGALCCAGVLGIVTAHYAVEGQGLYGLPLAEYFPYAVTRSWHTQLSVLWIATAFLAAGLYVGPLLSKKDPKFQVWGVNFLFGSLFVIVVGGFVGQWAAVNRFITNLDTNYWFGHQGWEYVDLGRVWQIYLTIGLLLWVVLVLRALWPGLRETKCLRHLPGHRFVVTIGLSMPPADVGQETSLGAGRILALVGCSPVGRRRVRGVCHRDHFAAVRHMGLVRTSTQR
jgi:Nitric oxide reductase large subunit